MERRLIVVLLVIVAAVVVVGLSAAATMSQRGDSRGSARPTADPSGSAPGTSARAAKPGAAGKSTSSDPVATSGPSKQKLSDVESYWTKERMESATPMARSRDASTQSPSPSPSGKSAPGSTASTRAPATKSPRRTRTAVDDDVVTSPSKGDGVGYWTEERMDDAGPMDMTRPGPGPSGAPDTPPPGSTAPGTAP